METIKRAVKNLTATHTYSAGKELSEADLQSTLKALCDYTTSEAEIIWELNSSILEPAIAATGLDNIPEKQRFFRESGADSTMTSFDEALMENLRELVEYKVISEVSDWMKNPNPRKQPFRFNRNLELSATGDEFSTLHYSQENNLLILELRALAEWLLLEIHLPEFLRKQTVAQLSKPRLRWNGTKYVFDFTVVTLKRNSR